MFPADSAVMAEKLFFLAHRKLILTEREKSLALLEQMSSRLHIPPEQSRMPVLVPSILQGAFSGRLVSLGNNTLKGKLFHLQVLCPRLAKKKNKIKIGFELFKTLKLLAELI